MTSPDLPDPNQLLAEQKEEFWRSSGVIIFARMGIAQVAADVRRTPATRDATVTFSRQAPTDPGARADAEWTRRDLFDAAVTGGWVDVWLGHAWIALTYGRWEKYYRPAFARAAGVNQDQVTSDVIGDVRHMRNDILHNDGRASAKRTARCRILRRFTPGDKIILTADDVLTLMDNLQVDVVST